MDTRERDKFHEEICRRMAEPEDLNKLRRQKERLEAERREAAQAQQHAWEAAALRNQIRAMGAVPVA